MPGNVPVARAGRTGLIGDSSALLPHAPVFPVFPRRSGLSETALGRLVRVFSSIIRYHRLAARFEVQHGGEIPAGELRALISGWARDVLPLLHVEVQRVGPIAPLDVPAIFVGNHLSYLDIPVLMSQVPVVFLGKEEISRWPVFGPAGRRAGMVFVKRESDGSRRQALKAITDCVRERGMSLGLFPSGTTTLDEARPWRSGAFRIARLGEIPVQPFRLTYEPLSRAAFIGKDALLPHLYRLLRSGTITATIEFGEPLMVMDPDATAEELWTWTRKAAPQA